MVRETWIQSLVASYQRFLKWYLIPPCLTLSNIRYVSRVKWSNHGKGVAPSPTTIEKGAFGSPSTKGRQLHFLLIPIGLLFPPSQAYSCTHFMLVYCIHLYVIKCFHLCPDIIYACCSITYDKFLPLT